MRGGASARQLKVGKWVLIGALTAIAVVAVAAHLLIQPEGEVLVTGSGATFPLPQIQAWIRKFTSDRPRVKIEYAGVGSGQGISNLLDGVVDFAASDVPLTTSQHERAVGKFGRVYQLPYLLGAVAIIYNVPEIRGESLKLTPQVLVDILLGKITHWDDPRIKELNPGLSLPRKEIVLVYRSDSSGTTEIFTRYLSYSSQEWKQSVGFGKVVRWPLEKAGRATGAKGNAGVAQMVRDTPYTIGYVEVAFAKGLGVVALHNRAGNFVTPTPTRVMKAAASLPDFDPASDISKVSYLDAIFGNEDPDAYPISSPTFLIVKDARNYDRAKARALAAFLKFIATEGQESGNLVEGYAPVPRSIREKILSVASLLERR